MLKSKMNRIRIIAFLILVAAAPVYLLAQSDIMTINNIEVFKKKSRPPVAFTHANHMTFDGVNCTDCHHLYDGGKNVLDPSELTEGNPMIKCSNCHTEKADLEKAYHRQCIQCHDKAVKQGKKNSPRMCGECHKRTK
jgi:hypothetical protein